MAWALFEQEARQYEGWYASRRGQRVDRAERRLLEWLLSHFPTARSVLELVAFLTTLEFPEEPVTALAEAARVARQGMLLIVLNRWSLGGFSRRWGSQAHRPLLSQAHDFSLVSLRAHVHKATDGRLRKLRWTSTFFPAGFWMVRVPMPVGEVLGMALEFAASTATPEV